MKKIIALILVAIMVLSFSTVAFAAASPTGGTVTGGGTKKPVAIAAPSAEGKAALEAALDEQLKGKLAEGETAAIVASFSAEAAGKVEANASGVKAGDTVYVLFRSADGKIRLIKGTAAKDGVVTFNAPGAGDFAIVLVSGGAATVPSTGDSNRMMKLVFAGIAAIMVMTVAGVAIKRTND